MYLITFIKKNFFHILQKIVEIYQLFPCKTTYYVKRQENFLNFSLKICFFWSRYVAGTKTGTVTFQK
jgi:hypothetical protein